MKHIKGREALADAAASLLQESHEVVEALRLLRESHEGAEALRLSRLAKVRILDTAAEPEYDDLVNLAAALCGSQVGVLTFIDDKRRWPKAKTGIVCDETPREYSFCNIAIQSPSEVLVIEDSLVDERMRHSPWANDDLDALRFYAGVPLVTEDGYALGALCVCDREPRTLTLEQMEHLRALGRVANKMINARAI